MIIFVSKVTFSVQQRRVFFLLENCFRKDRNYTNYLFYAIPNFNAQQWVNKDW